MDWCNELVNPNLIQTGIFIGGKWLSEQRETVAVTNPANGEVIARVAQATREDLYAALKSSEQGFNCWRQLTAKQRSNLLRRWYELIIEHRADLARILTYEQGKPLSEAQGEIDYGASYIQWYSEESKRIYGETISANNPHQHIRVELEPIGVCAAITPWNFPNAMLSRKLAPALAAGCSMLVKPASLTPLSANALAYLADQAGILPGVINVIHGTSGPIGDFLCQANSVRKLSFTGSTEVGIWLYQNSANSLKKLSLELGGNAPLIVCADADLDLAVNAIMHSKFRNSGQTCVCTNRVLVHASLKAELVKRLATAVAQLTIGPGSDPATKIGPLIDNKALIHVQSLVADALTHGAELICGGQVAADLGGLFFEPTMLNCPHSNLRMFKEEIFGPILALYSFTHDDEAINLANQTEYGLASYVMSSNISRVHYYTARLNYGMVGVNTGLISAENVPFGGIKHSGFGREGGRSGLSEYLTQKYICTNLA
jgi:succinate-semialdehyde dehydrogenase/glutarate-semialdehyde dehydrogenase